MITLSPEPGRQVFRDLRAHGVRFAAADLLYKAVAFAVLTPLSALLLRLFITVSGRSVLADEDILRFAIHPLGLLTIVVVGAVSLAILALRQATLMQLGFAVAENRTADIRAALRASGRKAPVILALAVRIAARVLLLALPFLAVAGLTFWMLLTEYDINYYLAQKPAAFWAAAAIMTVLGAALALLLLRLLFRWAYALPLVLFEHVPANRALPLSTGRTEGHRRFLAGWLLAWLGFGFLLSLVVTGPIGLLGRWLVPRAAGSLSLLIPTLGGLLLLWGAGALAVSVLSAAFFSLLLVRLYRTHGMPAVMRSQVPEETAAAPAAARRPFSRQALMGGAAALLAAIAVAGGLLLLLGTRMQDRAAVIAHRGASGAAPENTLAAIRRAIADRADWVEIDVQENAEGTVIVAHDSDFQKTAGHAGKVWTLTGADLAQLDIGAWFGPAFAGEHVPTLDEVLTLCKDTATGVVIELKHYGHNRQLEERVVELVEAHGMADRVMLMSLKYESVRKVKALRPAWKVGLLAAVTVGNLLTVDADFLAVNAKLATRAFVRAAHRRGKDVYVWTVNSTIDLTRFIGRGVDGVITDEPARARAVLAERAELSPVERLLAQLALLFGVPPEEPAPIEDA